MQTGNPLDEFLSLLSQAMPDIQFRVDRHPGTEDKAAWIALSAGNNSHDIEVEYRPGRGFGLHLSDDDLPFGGPDEICVTPAEAIARLTPLLQQP